MGHKWPEALVLKTFPVLMGTSEYISFYSSDFNRFVLAFLNTLY